MLGLMRRSGWVAATVLVALVLTHDLVFLLGYGAAYRDALVRTGHDDGWRTTVFLVLAMGGVLLLAAAAQDLPARPRCSARCCATEHR